MNDNGNQHLCRICGRTCRTANALTKHLTTCRKRPSREVLAADCEAGATMRDMAEKHCVSWHVMRQWLTDFNLEPNGKRPMRIFPGYAPKRMSGHLNCETCDALDWCRVLMREMNWVLCEGPDEEQVEAWERQGIDVLQLTTELWALHPEIWG